ncbi:MAG: dTDP-4-dehydrorhamnose 3,5-epimerase [Polyangiaceae bacterium]
MRIVDLEIPGPKLIHLDEHEDERGLVFEVHRQSRYADGGIDDTFVQDTCSRSRRGVVRGLHLQIPHDQSKLVMVLEGRVWDVAVDARPDSPHRGRWVGVELGRARQFYIPPGFAHGFVALEDAVMLYKLSREWRPGDDRTIAWNDPEIGIDWPLPCEPILSPKDAAGTPFGEYLAAL